MIFFFHSKKVHSAQFPNFASEALDPIIPFYVSSLPVFTYPRLFPNTTQQRAFLSNSKDLSSNPSNYAQIYGVSLSDSYITMKLLLRRGTRKSVITFFYNLKFLSKSLQNGHWYLQGQRLFIVTTNRVKRLWCWLNKCRFRQTVEVKLFPCNCLCRIGYLLPNSGVNIFQFLNTCIILRS